MGPWRRTGRAGVSHEKDWKMPSKIANDRTGEMNARISRLWTTRTEVVNVCSIVLAHWKLAHYYMQRNKHICPAPHTHTYIHQNLSQFIENWYSIKIVRYTEHSPRPSRFTVCHIDLGLSRIYLAQSRAHLCSHTFRAEPRALPRNNVHSVGLFCPLRRSENILCEPLSARVVDNGTKIAYST